MASGSSATFKFQWKSLSCQGLERESHSAVDVNGIIYSFGGWGDNYSETESIEIHVLNTFESSKQWKLLVVKNNDFTPLKRYCHTVVASGLLIYLWGGTQGNNKLYVFNTETLEWEKCEVKGEVPASRENHTATVVRNKMYIFGGQDSGTSNLSSSVAYLDFSTLCWSFVSPENYLRFNGWDWLNLIKNDLTPRRIGHSATVYGDRFIHFFGGSEDKLTVCNSLVCFDVDTNEWTFPEITDTIPEPRWGHCAFNYKGFMFIFGGNGNNGRLNDLFSYDFVRLEWTKLNPEGQKPDPRYVSQSVLIKDQVFIFGGRYENLNVCIDTFVLTIGSKQQKAK